MKKYFIFSVVALIFNAVFATPLDNDSEYNKEVNWEVNSNDDDLLNKNPETTVITKYLTNYETKYMTKTETRKVTTTRHSYETYTHAGYMGATGSKYQLGVNELKEYSIIYAKFGGKIYSPSKYVKWLIKSNNEPSRMYLASDKGDFSNYCLDVGSAENSNSYYLTINKCSKTSFMFKFNIPFIDANGAKINKSPIIAVYENADTIYTNDKGIPYCLYYSDILRVKECKNTKNYPNYKWTNVVQKKADYTLTSTEKQVHTFFKYIPTSTVIPKVTPTVITSILTHLPTPAPTSSVIKKNDSKYTTDKYDDEIPTN